MTTYNSIIYSASSSMTGKKTVDIKLNMQIIDAKNVFSLLYTNYNTKSYLINGLHFHNNILKFHNFFST